MVILLNQPIIEGLGADCETNQEEIFGPVVTLQPFKTEEEALQLANATDYGLAARSGRRIFQKPIVLQQKWKVELFGSIAGCSVICELHLAE